MDIEQPKQEQDGGRERLLDVLYELLAQGAGPYGSASIDQIEVLLHEHARAPKSEPELRAFFEKHQLSMNPSDYVVEPELSQVASGLYRDRDPSAILTLEAVDPLRGQEAALLSGRVPAAQTAPIEKVELPRPSPVREPPAERRSAISAGQVAIAAAALLAGVGFALGYVRAQGLEAELAQARVQQQTSDRALTALERKAALLSAELERSNEQRSALGDSFQAYMLRQEAQRAREQAALEQLLGRRYRTLQATLIP